MESFPEEQEKQNEESRTPAGITPAGPAGVTCPSPHRSLGPPPAGRGAPHRHTRAGSSLATDRISGCMEPHSPFACGPSLEATVPLLRGLGAGLRPTVGTCPSRLPTRARVPWPPSPHPAPHSPGLDPVWCVIPYPPARASPRQWPTRPTLLEQDCVDRASQRQAGTRRKYSRSGVPAQSRGASSGDQTDKQQRVHHKPEGTRSPQALLPRHPSRRGWTGSDRGRRAERNLSHRGLGSVLGSLTGEPVPGLSRRKGESLRSASAPTTALVSAQGRTASGKPRTCPGPPRSEPLVLPGGVRHLLLNTARGRGLRGHRATLSSERPGFGGQEEGRPRQQRYTGKSR